MIPPPEPGIYHGIPFEEYLQWDAASSHWLQVVDRQSPAHAQWLREHASDSKDKAFGRMLHKLSLKTIDFPDTFVIRPDVNKRTKAGKAAIAEFEEQQAGRQAVDRADYDRARTMAKAIREHKAAKVFLTHGEAEVCAVWDDDETGLRCKARYDYLHANLAVIADIKSTRNAADWAFSRAIVEYGYHRQAAFYLDGLHALTGMHGSFVYIAVEKQEPFGVAAYEADHVTLVAGQKSYKRALFVVRQCTETGIWPNYSQEWQTITIPRWLIREEGLEELVV